MEYTKGEWVVEIPCIEPKRLIIDARWKEGKQNWHRSIARTFGYCDSMEEEQANANLISASPDMYEALRHTETMLANLDRERGLNQQQILLHKEVSKALNKAEAK